MRGFFRAIARALFGPRGSGPNPETSAGARLVECPGCGGRGRFEWAPKPGLSYATDAPCAQCGGTGRIPASWLPGGNARR